MRQGIAEILATLVKRSLDEAITTRKMAKTEYRGHALKDAHWQLLIYALKITRFIDLDYTKDRLVLNTLKYVLLNLEVFFLFRECVSQ